MEGSSQQSRQSTPTDTAAPIVRRPIRAEVYKKQLTGIEQAVILAMLEIAGGADVLWMSVPRIAAYSKFDEKSVQRAIWGDHRKHPGQPKPKRQKGQPDKECPFCPNCLISRRILQPLAPAKWREHRPARYRLNLEILDDSPQVRRYLDQRNLNFLPPEKRPTVANPSDPRSHDSRSKDSKTLDSKERGFSEKAPLSFSTTVSQADFEQLRQLDSEENLFRWLCMRTGAAEERPALFSIQFSQADSDDLEKMIAARSTEELEKQFGPLPEAPTEEEEEQYFQWACQRVGVTPERGLYLELLDRLAPLAYVTGEPGNFAVQQFLSQPERPRRGAIA